MSDNTDEVVWPVPTLQPWDVDNLQTLNSQVSNPDLVEPQIVLMSGKHVLNDFVQEYIDNVNYDDSELYTYDGYAVYIKAEVLDQREAGLCVDGMCWEFKPKYSTNSFDFKSFSLEDECEEAPNQNPDVISTDNDAFCEDGSEYIGNGFNVCWGLEIQGDIGVASTEIVFPVDIKIKSWKVRMPCMIRCKRSFLRRKESRKNLAVPCMGHEKLYFMTLEISKS